ncbi:MAG: beta-N-acetylhexosaminidase, partial [Pedobacter sp.]
MKKLVVYLQLLTCNFLLSALSFDLSAQEINIIPKPVELRLGNQDDAFLLSSETVIYSPDSALNPSVTFLANYLKTNYSLTLQVKTKLDSTDKSKITLYLTKPSMGEPPFDYHSTYNLHTYKGSIKISSHNPELVFNGIQTLIQLLPTEKANTLNIPAVTINDYARFDYRGMHLDVSRHFFDVAFVKQYIDY